MNIKTKAMLYFVDLAGSERQLTSDPIQTADPSMLDRAKESCKINQSLVVLSNVITSLSKGQKYPHFRDSKLTHYLRDVFGGNARTTLITNILNQSDYLFETYNTLRFGQTAKTIRVHYKANYEAEGGSEDDLKSEINFLMGKLYRYEKKLPEIANEDSQKVVKHLTGVWDKIKCFIGKKGILAKKAIDEVEFQFGDAINTVKGLLQNYDCSNLANSQNLRNILKDMENFFERLMTSDRLLNGFRAGIVRVNSDGCAGESYTEMN
jgi:hypothetical protein